jgi:hypothetical protein
MGGPFQAHGARGAPAQAFSRGGTPPPPLGVATMPTNWRSTVIAPRRPPSANPPDTRQGRWRLGRTASWNFAWSESEPQQSTGRNGGPVGGAQRAARQIQRGRGRGHRPQASLVAPRCPLRAPILRAMMPPVAAGGGSCIVGRNGALRGYTVAGRVRREDERKQLP